MENFTQPKTNRLNRKLFCLLIGLLVSLAGISQNVAINVSGNPPNASAGLDVDFPNKGLLIPRIALTGTAAFTPLSAHVAGMIVYNTATVSDVIPGFYYNDGTKWVAGFPSGIAVGNMLYWNGTNWVLVPAGLPGQYLQLSASNLPVWGGLIVATPTIVTAAATLITGTTATSGANISSDGGSPILSRGICWNTLTGPTIANNKITDAAGGIGTYVSNLTGLLPATPYYVRAWAMNNTAINYGNEITFTTLPVVPTLAATTVATAITATTAISGGNVTNTGGAPILERGILLNTAGSPTLITPNTIKIIDGAPGLGSFISNITGLTPGTHYYYAASYATNSAGTSYGAQIYFSTALSLSSTTAASSITSTSASTGGVLAPFGTVSFAWKYGTAYSLTSNAVAPLYVDAGTYPAIAGLTYVTNLTGLTSNTIYYIRAYAETTFGVFSYGPELSFTTAAPIAPVVAATNPITNITSVSGTSGGAITSDGGVPVTAKGVCWGTSANPTVGVGNFTSDGTGTAAFISNITGLTASTTYYVRAYATNSVGTSYGTQVTFTTCGTPYYTVGQNVQGGIVFYVDCTGQAGLIAATADQGSGIPYGCQGTVTGATGTAVYSGAANTTAILAACTTPGIAAQLCRNYNGGGYTDWYLPSSDELQLMYNVWPLLNLTSGLMTYWSSTETSATTAAGYFVNNGYGYPMGAMKGYGTQMVVRAIRKWVAAPPVVPTLTTDPLTNVLANSATCGGNISSDGGAVVTARGVCWSTTTGPTVALPTKTTDGTGLGSFVSNITGLTSGTTYYVRAYATNSAGTAYGSEISFTPNVPTLVPTVTTDLIGSLVGSIAEGNYTVVNEGASPVTAAGLVWGIAPGATITTNTGMVTDIYYLSPNSVGFSWPLDMTGLTVGTTYYVRTFATNANGTGYGADVSFTATAASLGQYVVLNYQSGYVFDVDITGSHGLLALSYSNGVTTDWGCASSVTGATGTVIGTGNSNTATILTDIATNLCSSTSPFMAFAPQVAQGTGFPDWYLPSSDELNLLWTNRAADLTGTLDALLSTAIGVAPIWSSSEVDQTHAWSLDGTGTMVNTGLKTDQNNVWPIRSF
jgi:hypothetical protein